MLEEENIEPVETQEKTISYEDRLRLIKSQWIPDVEAMLADVSDEAKRKEFEEQLAGIKSDTEAFEKNSEKDETEIKKIYERAEDLFAQVRECFPEEDDGDSE